MKRFLCIVLVFCATKPLCAQYVYTINADSVKITNHCDTAELILENHTQTVPGFLFNKGRGRTEFRRVLQKVNDSLYLLGPDTLVIRQVTANNGLVFSGTTVQLGGSLIRNTVLDQRHDSLVLITPNGATFLQQDSSTQAVILPGNAISGQLPIFKRSKRKGFIIDEEAVAANATGTTDGALLYCKEITNETLPPGVSAAAFGSTNSFYSERIQGGTTGTVMLWNIAGPTSLRGRTWNSWMTLVNLNNPYLGNTATPFVNHALPFYITPGKGAWPTFANNAMALGSTFAVDADTIPLFLLNLPTIPVDTTNNKPLILNPSTGAVQYSSWPSAGNPGIAADSVQAYVSGSSVTINNRVNILYVDPASTQSSLTVMLPANPHNSNTAWIYFGGVLSSGTIITNLTISANSGQTLIQSTAPATAIAGQCIAYKWRASTAQWYRMN